MAPQSERRLQSPGDRGLGVRRSFVACIGLALVVAPAVLAYRQFVAPRLIRDAPDSSGKIGQVEANLLPPLESPYLNATNSATYVGTETCRECHSDQHATYLETTHSRSLRPVDPAQEPPDAVFEHALSGLRYEVHRDGEHLWHRESVLVGNSEPLTTADRPLKYLVGSGRFARTYLSEVDGFLIESPLSWYASTKSWRMSPGYDRAQHHSFQRSVTDDCLYCHAGRATTIGGSPSRIKLHEFSIGCERCHGPGSLHTALQRAGDANTEGANTGPINGAPDGKRAPIDYTIVNPRDLPRDLSEAICQQCHLESLGRANVLGRTPNDYRPGLRWTDFCINYDALSPSGQMTVTGHVQQMHMSLCFQDSTTLTCITCHDMHARPSPAERVQHYRAACLTCHEDGRCKLALEHRQERNANDCAACHMPHSNTDVPHVAFTHHRIGIHSDKPGPLLDEFTAVPLAPVLDIAQLPEAHRRRNLGLAYLQRYVNFWQDARLDSYRQQADELLQDSYRRGLNDEAICAALATLAGQRGDLPNAEQFVQSVLHSKGAHSSERITVLNLLANSRFAERRFREAEEALDELIRLRREPRDWVLLARCREQQNNVAGAIAALEKVVEIDGRMPEAYEILSELYGRRDDPEAKRRSAARARQLRENTAK